MYLRIFFDTVEANVYQNMLTSPVKQLSQSVKYSTA